MTKSITFDDEAVEELESAAQWYEARRQDLGIDFVRDIREALLRIASRPHTWPLAPNVPEHLNVRRFVLRRFPYAVVFAELTNEIRVLAIAHMSREPGFWRERL
jgi:plasmid stabilization system protein ParE